MNIPVIIVSGYLGAGKTTAINAFLSDPKGLRAIILVNDFGSINIDAALIKNRGGDTIALTNGCACCSIGNDLLSAALNARSQNPDLIIVEASGVSEPQRLANALCALPHIDAPFVVTVVNGQVADKNASDKFIGKLYNSQIMSGNAILLNRGPCTMLPKGVPIIDHLIEVLEHGRSHPFELTEHSTNLYSTTIWIQKGIEFEQLKQLLQALPPNIHRVKGIIETSIGTIKLDCTQGHIRIEHIENFDPNVLGALILIGVSTVAIQVATKMLDLVKM